MRRERSHDRREIVRRAAEAARIGFWRAETEVAVRDLVAAANRAIVDGNVHLVPADRIETFDVVDIVDRWRRLRR